MSTWSWSLGLAHTFCTSQEGHLVLFIGYTWPRNIIPHRAAGTCFLKCGSFTVSNLHLLVLINMPIGYEPFRTIDHAIVMLQAQMTRAFLEQNADKYIHGYSTNFKTGKLQNKTIFYRAEPEHLKMSKLLRGPRLARAIQKELKHISKFQDPGQTTKVRGENLSPGPPANVDSGASAQRH